MFEACLDGFFPNVQEILEKFKFRNQIDTMIEADILGAVIVFFKYVSDRYKGQPFAEFTISKGASFEDLIAAKGKSDVSFNNPDELGSGKELVDKVSGLIAVFQNPAIDFKNNRASGDSIVTIFGQEKDHATAGLAKMNLILHRKGTGEIKRGNTLVDPAFTDDFGELKKFDFIVMNPPFSDKSWSDGIKTAADSAVVPEIYKDEYDALTAYAAKSAEKDEADKTWKEACKALDDEVEANNIYNRFGTAKLICKNSS